MGDSKRYVLFVLFCLVLPVLPLSHASALPSQTNTEPSFFQENGITFTHTLSLNGSSTHSLVEYQWVLVSLDLPHSPLDSGKLTSVTAVSDGLWDWELEVNISTYDCTCKIFLTDANSNNHHPHASIVVYLGSENHRPHILPISAIGGPNLEKPHFLLSNSNLLVEIPLIVQSSGSQETFVNMGVCPAPNGICLSEMVDFGFFNSSMLNGALVLEFDRLNMNLDDGFWLFNITISDALLRSSNTERFLILIDQNLPSVTLSCDVDSTESSGSSSEVTSIIPPVDENSPISFSSTVDDGYVGGENILTWTLVLPDGSRRALHQNEQVSPTLISLNPDLPGTWTVELLVRDTVGWLSHSSIDFTVENKAPVAQLELDSFVIHDGATVTLSSGESWELNSSQSSDTANDHLGLIHTWYVNGNTHVTGKQTLSSSDFTGTGTYEILLVVEDDNGATSEVSFQVKISESIESDTLSSQLIFASISILLFLSLAVGYLVASSRKQSNQTSVPKWISNDSSLDDGENNR